MAKYLFEQAQLTCEALEDELGVPRTSITSITVHPSGAVEVETALAWSDNGQKLIKDALAKRGVGLGKKPAPPEKT